MIVVKKASSKDCMYANLSSGSNDFLDAHHYPLPTTKDIFTKISGGTCFAKIDLSDAFLQIEVDVDSKELLTINTHQGLLRYNQLTFSVKSASVLFKQVMDAMLTGLTGTAAFIDDIIVSETQDELLNRLFWLWTYSATWFSCSGREMSDFLDVDQVSGFYIR